MRINGVALRVDVCMCLTRSYVVYAEMICEAITPIYTSAESSCSSFSSRGREAFWGRIQLDVDIEV